jgi:hypothetical protein
MRNSEKVSKQFDIVQNYLDLVDYELQKLPTKFVSSEVIYSLHNRIQEIASEIEELHYETCMPLEMAEDERDEEIRVLEKRLAELKGTTIPETHKIDLGSGMYDAREGNEDSFSNLGMQ